MEEARSYPSYRAAPPKRIGGALCLDFINTVEWRGDPTARSERLLDYDELVAWAGRVGIADARVQASMRRAAQQSPGKARAALADAIALREAIASLVMRRPGAVAAFNSLLRRLHVSFELEEEKGALRTIGRLADDVLRAPLAALALDAMELATSARLAHVRSCGNERCGWVFLDLSRNKSRRWCDMSACGNVAKARAHYHRHRREQS